MLRGSYQDNEMPSPSTSSDEQSRVFANATITRNKTKKKRITLSSLKLLLAFCIMILAVANIMPMHHPVVTREVENRARKAEFLEDEAISSRNRMNAGKINDENNRKSSNNHDFDSLEEGTLQLSKDLPVRQDQSRSNAALTKVVFNSSNIDQYPSALHPITFPKCCPMISLPMSRHHPPCDTVCYTEQACNDELYPYSTKEIKSFLSRRNIQNRTDRLKISVPCDEMNSLRKPQYQWCQHWKIRNLTSIDGADNNVKSEKYLIDPYAAKLPPPGCSTYQSGGGSGSYQHVILFPQSKLAFCGIPKV